MRLIRVNRHNFFGDLMLRDWKSLLGSAMVACSVFCTAHADTATFFFTDPGTTYTGFIFPGDPRIGGHVYQARIYLDLEVFEGADASQFDTDLTLPIIPDDGASPLITFNGADLGWSGSGEFHHYVETKAHNGIFIDTLFGAASAPLDAVLLKSARIELDYTPIPEPTSLATLGIASLAFRRRRPVLNH